MIIRSATMADAPALAAIYGHHALNGFGTFEETAPSPEDMAARMKAVTDLGLPYRIAEIDVNPVICGPDRAIAVDALIVRATPS